MPARTAARRRGGARPRTRSGSAGPRAGAPRAPSIRAVRWAITKSSCRRRTWADAAVARSRCSAASSGRRSKNAASASAACAEAVCGMRRPAAPLRQLDRRVGVALVPGRPADHHVEHREIAERRDRDEVEPVQARERDRARELLAGAVEPVAPERGLAEHRVHERLASGVGSAAVRGRLGQQRVGGRPARRRSRRADAPSRGWRAPSSPGTAGGAVPGDPGRPARRAPDGPPPPPCRPTSSAAQASAAASSASVSRRSRGSAASSERTAAASPRT